MKYQLERIKNRSALKWLMPKIARARQWLGTNLDRFYRWLEGRTETEIIATVVAMILVLVMIDLFVGVHPGWKHAFYLPVWFASWFAPRRAALSVAAITAAWIIGSPYLRDERYTAGLILGMVVAIGTIHFGALSFSYLRGVYDAERHRARMDPLTGCMNAAGLYEAAEQALAEQSEIERPFALIYLDLDKFKELNDTCGHVEADKVLALVGGAILQETRTTDMAARMGGDEFVVWLHEIGPDLAFIVARRIRDAIETAQIGSPHRVSASVGCVSFMEAPASVLAALQIADARMYVAKSSGQGRISSEVWGAKPNSTSKSFPLISVR